MRYIDPVEHPSKIHVTSVDAFKYKTHQLPKKILAPLFTVLILTFLGTG
jgi:hypothetical protein